MCPVHPQRGPVRLVCWYRQIWISGLCNSRECEGIPFRSDFEGDSSDFLGELAEFVDHGVNDDLELYHDGPLYGNGDLLSEVAVCNGLADAGNVLYLSL